MLTRPGLQTVVLAAVFTACTNAAAQYVIDVYAIDTGGATPAGNSCSRLTASAGQAATGFSSGGGFSLSSGFQAIVASGPGDTIFFDGFEGCQP
ncbi:MAG: hypothetical protein JSS28_00550 [Proteobacteria bacterium]|nr:hypothetical protein [Pseudomonadota bacterium]